MPIPLSTPVKDYDDTLAGKLIRTTENPDSIGFIDGRWYSPSHDRRFARNLYDPNGYGFGVDKNKNEYFKNGEYTPHTDSKGRVYMTIDEERDLRNHTIANLEKSYDDRLDFARKTIGSTATPSEMKKAITLSAMYNLGSGYVADNLFEDRPLMESFLNGTDMEYSNHVNKYFKKKGIGSRGVNTNKFIQEQKLRSELELANKMKAQQVKVKLKSKLKADGGFLETQNSWDGLTLKEKNDVIKVAVQNGITALSEIRDRYNTFAQGGELDDDYLAWKQAIKEHKGIDIDNDVTYDYAGFYHSHPDEAWAMLEDNPYAHFTDEYKTVNHPTFSTESIYSGQKHPVFNPEGLVGGRWNRQGNEFTMSPDGYRGPVNMDVRRWYLENNEDNGVVLREADGSLPVYDGERWGGVLPAVTVTGHKNLRPKGGYIDIAKQHIRKNEGWVRMPMKDAPQGKNWRSIGYGFNDSGFRAKYPQGISNYYEKRGGITKAEAEQELDYILGHIDSHLRKVYGDKWEQFNDNQKAAIIDTYYQRPTSVIGKDSPFRNAVMTGDSNPGRFLGVKGYTRRNAIRQNLFGSAPASMTIQDTFNPVQAVDMSLSSPKFYTPLHPEVFGEAQPTVDNTTPVLQDLAPQPIINEAENYSLALRQEFQDEDRSNGWENFKMVMNLLSPSTPTSRQHSSFVDSMAMLGGVPQEYTPFNYTRNYAGGGPFKPIKAAVRDTAKNMLQQKQLYESNFPEDVILGRTGNVYSNYHEAKDAPLSLPMTLFNNGRRWVKDNMMETFPSGVSNCTLTATQWIDPMNPIKRASSIVDNPGKYNYSRVSAEEAIPGNIVISKVPGEDRYHTMLIEGFADKDGIYLFDGKPFEYSKGEPLVTYSKGGHDVSSLRKRVPLSVYTENSDGYTENSFYRYNYPNETYLQAAIVRPSKTKKK